MAKWFGSRIYVNGRRREKQQLNPFLAQAAGVSNGQQLYEGAVLEALSKIRQNRAGAIVLKAIDSFQSPWTRVIEILPPKEELKDIGMTGVPQGSGLPVWERSASAKDDKFKQGGVETTGDGTGSSSKLTYDPAFFGAYCQLRGFAEDETSITPDNVLLHELVHSYRQITGRWRHTPLGDGFEYVEELHAIAIANIYMSVEGVPNNKLRGSHSLVFQTLEKTPGQWMTWDMSFYMRYEKQFDQFAEDNPELYKPLAELKDPIGAWNPYRQRELDRTGALTRRPSEGIFGLSEMLQSKP